MDEITHVGLVKKISDGTYHFSMNPIGEVREKLSALCHGQWAGWKVYQFSKGTYNADGSWTMPKWAVDRWTRQMKTPYRELSEDEKESDRIEADKFIELLGGE